MDLKLKEKVLESVSAVLPITVIVAALGVVLVPIDIGIMAMFFAGAAMLIIGMGCFQLGSEMAMEPIGEAIGKRCGGYSRIFMPVLLCFVMGVIITVAEPDLQVLSEQVPAVPNLVLVLTVAAGVGVFMSAAAVRIRKRTELSLILIVLYAAAIVLSFFIPEDFFAVAFDSGGVTTGPITVPFIMAMGLGLSSRRSGSEDSFGLVAISSIGPILAVMLLSFVFRPEGAVYTAAAVSAPGDTVEMAKIFLFELPDYIKEVALSLLPIAAVFFLFQAATSHFRRRTRRRIVIGFIYDYIGLVLFLCGVNVGFAPLGNMLGSEIASGAARWLLIPVGMLIGYFIVKAEPAIQVLNRQIRDVTDGTIAERSMNRALSAGVSVSAGLAMLRILTGVPIGYILIPGYIAALVMSRLVPKIFVGIAFDSGGVASGPMTSTFLLPLCIGACESLGGNIMTDAFGAVALVALTPLIAIQIMGIKYRIKTARINAVASENVTENSDDIIDLDTAEVTDDE